MGRLKEQSKYRDGGVGFNNPNGNLAASLSQNGQRHNVCNSLFSSDDRRHLKHVISPMFVRYRFGIGSARDQE